MRERDYLGGTGVGERLMLKWTFRKWDLGVWTGMSWPMIGTDAWRLGMR